MIQKKVLIIDQKFAWERNVPEWQLDQDLMLTDIQFRKKYRIPVSVELIIEFEYEEVVSVDDVVNFNLFKFVIPKDEEGNPDGYYTFNPNDL